MGRALVRPYHKIRYDEIDKVDRWFEQRKGFHREYIQPIGTYSSQMYVYSPGYNINHKVYIGK